MTKDVKSGLLEFSDDQKVFVAVDEDDDVKKAVLIDREGNETALGALPTDEQVQEAVDAWLDDHPEATTTVQDGAITTAKLADESVTDDKLAADGIKAEVSDLKSDLQEAIDEFAVPTQEAVDNWLEAHPEATTTVVDGSLTEAKFTESLKLKTVNDYVTPEMFGAKGDGIADDTQAVKDALAYSASNGIRFIADNTYKTTDTITILNNAEINGLIKYYGSGTAIVVGYKEVSTNLLFKNIKVRVRADSFTDSVNSIGVYFGNVYNCNINIDYVSNFYKGVVFNAYQAGCAYNTIYIKRIELYNTGLVLNSDTGGWVNENTFYNGTFRQNTGFIYADNDVAVLIDSTRSYYNNANKFYNQCLEGAKTAIKIKYGDNNYFYDVRTEGVTTVLDCDYAYMNFVYPSFGNYSVINARNPNYIESPKIRALSTMMRLIFDTGYLGKEVAYNDSYGSFKYLSNLSGGRESWKIIESVSNKGLAMGSRRTWKMGVDMSNNKSKRIYIHADLEWIGGRCSFLCLDANGDDILTPPVMWNPSSTFVADTSAFSGHTAYSLGADTLDGNFELVQLPSDTATLWVCIWQNGNPTWYIKSVKFYSDDIATAIPSNGEHASLSAVPTSVGYDGQFVASTTPSNSCIGWIYYNSQWNVVPL